MDHAKGAHDDLSNVIAGVLWRLTPVQQTQPMPILPVLTKSEYGGRVCYGDNNGGAAIGYGGIYSGSASMRNPAHGLPMGRDSWDQK